MFYKKIIVLIALLAFTALEVIAKSPNPPPPDHGLADPPTPPVPIDDTINIILVLAVFLGIYIIYYHTLKNEKNAMLK